MGFKSSPQTTMLLSTVSSLAVISLAVTAPQYGGVQPSRQVSPSSVQCRVETTVIWDTQYQEKETQECVTTYNDVCETTFERQCQPTVRQECSVVYEKECRTVYQEVCVDQYKTEYEPYTETVCSTSTRRTVSTSGRGRATTRSGSPSPAPARRTP